MKWLSIAALALVGAGLACGGLARRAFLSRIARLQRDLKAAPASGAMRDDLPAEVLALARRLGAGLGPAGRCVRLTQEGQMWMRPGATPLAFTARQTIAVAQVGFLWRAWFRIGGLPMQIIDYLVQGQAGLQGRLFDVLAVADSVGGDAMFRGEAIRYLSELMWNPDALLFNRQLAWRVIDARTLAVCTGGGARRCEVRLILDDAGDPIRVESDDRPRMVGRTVVPCAWFARAGGYRAIAGRRIPTHGVAGWRLDGGEFIYWRGRFKSWSMED